MRPLISTAHYDLAVLVALVVPISGLAIWGWIEAWRARRNEQQLRGEIYARRGFPAAWRRGYFTDGDQ